MKLDVLQVVPERNLAIGGPAYSVVRLADALAHNGLETELWAIDNPRHGAVLKLEHARSQLWPASWAGAQLRGWAPGFAHALRQRAAQARLLHNHGLWMWPNRYARLAASAHRIPLVCSPRGMLQAWSLGRSRWSKALVWWAWERRNLHSVALFHATSEDEALAIRRAGLRQPIAVIANGVDMPPPVSTAERRLAREALGLADAQRMLLFMSRIHEKKALLPLLHAWQGIARAHPNWRLQLAGPDLDGYAVRVRACIVELGLLDSVVLPGMLEGAAKRQALAAADAFVLTSHSENFGIAVAEAAAMQLPVLVSDAMPWSPLVDQGGGWQVQATAASISAGLARMATECSAKWQTRGQLAQAYVAQHLGWPALAAAMRQSYEWLWQVGDRPSCVQLD